MVNFNIKFDYTLRREISKTVPPTTSSSELGNILTIGEATVVDTYSRQGSIKANVAYTEPGTGTSYTYIYPFIMLTTAAQIVPITTLGEITREYLPGRGTFIRTVDATDFMGKNTDPLDNVYGNYPLHVKLDALHFYEIPIFDITINSSGLVTSGQILHYDATLEDWTTGLITPQGNITVAADFPTLAAVVAGWWYNILANVTDNDPTKTNTGKSFLAGDKIYWTGSTWERALIFSGSVSGDLIGPGNPWTYLIAQGVGSPFLSRVCYQVFDSAEIAEREALSRKYEVEQFIENYNRIHNNDYSSMEGAYSANSNFQTYTV